MMPAAIEQKCCLEESYVNTCFQKTDIDAGFDPKKDCILCSKILMYHILDQVSLQLAWFRQRRMQGYTGKDLLFQCMTNKNYRYHAYRSYIDYIHGYLGPHNRRVVPACVVTYIRTKWPEDDGSYVGFQSLDDDEEQDELARLLADD